MAKWRHLRMSVDYEYSYLAIFPARRVNLEWIIQRFPKFKKGSSSNEHELRIRADLSDLKELEEMVLNNLEENGWEAYSYVHDRETIVTAFKRMEG